MLRLLISIIFLFAICFSSCKIPTHWKSDKGKKCEVHQLTLHKSLVRITYGYLCSPKTHLGKGSEEFPNARHQECGGCSWRPNKVVWLYTCSKCTSLKRKEIFRIKTKEERLEQKIRVKF